MRIKIFEGGDTETLENDVNQWLEDHPDIHINHITQSECGFFDPEEEELVGNTTITLFFEGSI